MHYKVLPLLSNTDLPPCTLSKLWLIIGQIFASNLRKILRGCQQQMAIVSNGDETLPKSSL